MLLAPRRPGRLYAFDGYACSGKSTLVEALRSKLFVETGIHPRVLTFPSAENPVGRFIREEVFTGKQRLHPTAMLHLFISDAIHVEAEAHRWLSEGRTVIYDRHPVASAVAYHLDYHSLQTILDVAQENLMLRPDLLFLLDVQVTTLLERLQQRGQEQPYESRDPSIIQLIQNRYASYYIQHSEFAMPLDGNRDVESIIADVAQWIAETEKLRKDDDKGHT